MLLFTMSRVLHNLFTVTGNSNTIYSKNRIGNTNVHSKLPIIVFQINSTSLMESEEFRKPQLDVATDLKYSYHFLIFCLR